MAACPNSEWCKGGSITCKECNGKGRKGSSSRSEEKPCNACNSNGSIDCSECNQCLKCGGNGGFSLFGFRCSPCNGTGRVDILTPIERGDWFLEREKHSFAAEYYELAASSGDSQAMYNLGIMYKRGLGVRRSPHKAREWLTKAKRHGRDVEKEVLDYLNKRDWKVKRSYCDNCKEWTASRHKKCSDSILHIDTEHFEIGCDRCRNTWPLENSEMLCSSCGHIYNTEDTKQTFVVRQDGNLLYILDHSGKLIVGRTPYYGQGYV